MVILIKKITGNPFLLFSPFLIISLILVFVLKTDATFGDESRYLTYASNMLKGFYSPPPPDIDLGNGPGYPIILIPFVGLNLPLVSITILNALFFYFSLVLIYKTLQKYVSLTTVLIISLFMAVFINAYETIPLIVTETITLFMITLTGWCITKVFDEKYDAVLKNKYIWLSGFFVGYLALIKPVFGYVIMVMLAGSLILWLLNRKILNYRKGFIIMCIGLATTLPYLTYTWNLTGRMFYWSSFGGDNLYWMASPYHGEYGSWINFNELISDTIILEDHVTLNKSYFESTHYDVYQEIKNLKGVELDDAMKEQAVANIKAYPKKFIINCISNVGRMLFNFPYSYKLQTPNTLIRIPFTAIIAFLALFSIIPTLLNWRKVPFSIRFLLFFVLIYLGGSILGSAETRMLTIVVPVFLLWIGYILHKSVRINLSFQ